MMLGIRQGFRIQRVQLNIQTHKTKLKTPFCEAHFKLIMENINNLICFLLALQNYCKDIHYNSKGDAFYSKHLLADRVQDNISDYIDRIKEVCILGNGEQTLSSWEYLSAAIGLIPEITENDTENFKSLAALITSVLSLIEQIESSKGEDNLIAAIAEDLQNSLGLVNRQITE